MEAEATSVAGAATPAVFPLRSSPGLEDHVVPESGEYEAYAFQTELPELIALP